MSARVGLVLLVAVSAAGCGDDGGSSVSSVDPSLPTWSETIPSTEVPATDAPVVTDAPVTTVLPSTLVLPAAKTGVVLIDLGAPAALTGVSDMLTPVDEVVAASSFESQLWSIKDSQVYEVRRSVSPDYADESLYMVVDKIAVVTDAAGDNDTILNAVTAQIAGDTGLAVGASTTEDRDGVSVTYATVGDYGTNVMVTVAVSTIPDTAFHAVSIERQASVPGSVTQPDEIIEFVSGSAAGVPVAVPYVVLTGWDFEDGLNMFNGAPQHSRSITYVTHSDHATTMAALVAAYPDWHVTDDLDFGYLSDTDTGMSIAVAPSGDGGVNITVAFAG